MDLIMQSISFTKQFLLSCTPLTNIILMKKTKFYNNKATGHYLNQSIDNYNHLIGTARYNLERFNSLSKTKFISELEFGIK